MAQSLGSQRGVVKLASSLLLAAVGVLVGAAGCAAGDGSANGDLAVEAVGTVQQAISCTIKGGGCPPDSICGDWTCPQLGGTCTVKAGAEDGSRCETTDGRGVCAGSLCCTGCLEKTKTGYVCRPGTATTACGGPTTICKDCTVTDACTVGVCLAGKFECDTEAAPANTPCSDGKKCNGEEVCSGTSCKAGAKLDCDDNEDCTNDECDEEKGCTHTPRTGVSCNDGDACTTDDKCTAEGTCKGGQEINCADGEVCTTDKCIAGKCVNAATTVSCTDNDPCTTGDKCVSGKCQGTSANGVNCDDNKACTVDKQVACNSTDCSHTFASADVACPAEDKCHENGHCSGTDETCVQGPEINCDDSNPCTKDSCDPEEGCLHVNDAAADCSDGDPCTDNDVCVAGVCGGKPKKCLALDACHEGGSCDPQSGTCDDPRAKDGKECPGGTCESGKCIVDPNANVGGQGAGGDGTESSAGAGGEENAGTAGVDGGGTSGSGGTSTGGTEPEPVDETRVFKREPGGCSCNVPASPPSSLTWLAGLGALALVAARRRGGAGRERQTP